MAFSGKMGLEPREHDALLRLVLPLFILVRNFTFLVGLEEENLAKSFVGIDLRWKRSGIADFQCNETLPFRLEGRHVHDNPAARVGRFAKADGQNVARDAEIFYRPPQRKRVWGNQAFGSLELYKRPRIK